MITYICDECGEEINEQYEPLKLQFEFGYGSFYDNEKDTFYYCPSCGDILYKQRVANREYFIHKIKEKRNK